MAKRATTSDAASPINLAKEKLEESQITIEQAKALGMEFLDPIATRQLGENFSAYPSIKINYFDPHTGAAMRPRAKWPEFFRVRYLYPAHLTPDERAKLPRYSQLSGVGACAYFPSCMPWPEIMQDAAQQFEPADTGQIQIQHHKIRPLGLHQNQGIPPVRRLEDGPLRQRGKQTAQPDAYDRVVVDQQRFHAAASAGRRAVTVIPRPPSRAAIANVPACA